MCSIILFYCLPWILSSRDTKKHEDSQKTLSRLWCTYGLSPPFPPILYRSLILPFLVHLLLVHPYHLHLYHPTIPPFLIIQKMPKAFNSFVATVMICLQSCLRPLISRNLRSTKASTLMSSLLKRLKLLIGTHTVLRPTKPALYVVRMEAIVYYRRYSISNY